MNPHARFRRLARRLAALCLGFLPLGAATRAGAETGYDLWLRYVPVTDAARQGVYRQTAAAIVVQGRSPTARAALAELQRGLRGLLGVERPAADAVRADASLGINGTVINSVNANPASFSPPYLEKTAALARALRPWGIRVYLSANFAAPMLLGGLPTSDPRDPAVARWWREKAAEIYRLVPDFGGFLVKADSEGQPGPQGYGRTHADGANVLADALKPHGGIVMWRAFVYDPEVDPDRIKRAYLEFVPLDGCLRDNVFVQVKNGPLDFQPREPFHPLFGAMPRTPLMGELQITLWEGLVFHYTRGAEEARRLEARWKSLEGKVDDERHRAVLGNLRQQAEDAAAWRDKCLRYFQRFSKRPSPGAQAEPALEGRARQRWTLGPSPHSGWTSSRRCLRNSTGRLASGPLTRPRSVPAT